MTDKGLSSFWCLRTSAFVPCPQPLNSQDRIPGLHVDRKREAIRVKTQNKQPPPPNKILPSRLTLPSRKVDPRKTTENLKGLGVSVIEEKASKEYRWQRRKLNYRIAK